MSVHYTAMLVEQLSKKAAFGILSESIRKSVFRKHVRCLDAIKGQRLGYLDVGFDEWVEGPTIYTTMKLNH